MSFIELYNIIENYIIEYFIPILDYSEENEKLENNDDYEYISDNSSEEESNNLEESNEEKEPENIIKLYCSSCDESIDNNKYLITPCEHLYHLECLKIKLNQNDNEKIKTLCNYCEEIFIN